MLFYWPELKANPMVSMAIYQLEISGFTSTVVGDVYGRLIKCKK